METNTSPALPILPAFNETVYSESLSFLNVYRINKAVDGLALHLTQPGNHSKSMEFYNLCFSLARGIDYALANDETAPPNASELLPVLIKQMYERKSCEDEVLSVEGVLVLMIYVRNACKVGWFDKKDSEELISIADEIGKIYYTKGNVTRTYGPSSSCHSAVLTIMGRFYRNMMLGPIIVSVETKPGHGAFVVDFLITRKNYAKSDYKYIWLMVAQTDNINTAACLTVPQQASFLMNEKGIDTRSQIGLQVPTCVNSMLKFGTNLLQVVGQFDAPYIILLAYMNYVPLNQEVERHNQSNLQLMNYMNSVVSEYGSSSSSSRYIHRTPVANQALPVQSRALVGPQQNYFATPRVSLSNHSLSILNMLQVSAGTHNQAPSQLQYPPYRSVMQNEFRNSHLQQILNPMPQRGSQANAAEAATNSQQARAIASTSHAARQEETGGPPVSRTGDSGQKLTTDVIWKNLVAPSSHQAQRPRPQPGTTSSQMDMLIANSSNAHNTKHLGESSTTPHIKTKGKRPADIDGDEAHSYYKDRYSKK